MASDEAEILQQMLDRMERITDRVESMQPGNVGTSTQTINNGATAAVWVLVGICFTLAVVGVGYANWVNSQLIAQAQDVREHYIEFNAWRSNFEKRLLKQEQKQ